MLNRPLTGKLQGGAAHERAISRNGTTQAAIEIFPPAPDLVLDKKYIRTLALAHERAGFDRLLIGYYPTAPDGFQLAAYIATQTERLGLLLAHQPGFIAPTLAARALATLDHLSEGRLALHVISGGDDATQRRDGDTLSKDERYARTDEYVGLLRALWHSRAPLNHSGRFYSFENAATDVRPYQPGGVPIFFGGASDAAIKTAGRHADTYALWGEPYAQVRDIIARVREAADGRRIGFNLSLRVILGDTERQAWDKAADILAKTKVKGGQAWIGPNNGAPANEGSRRLLAAAAQGERLDKCLWTGIAAATGARGNTTALVGTPEQVADGLLDYWKLGVNSFLIRGFDPLPDAIEYGAKVLPLVREKVALAERAVARL